MKPIAALVGGVAAVATGLVLLARWLARPRPVSLYDRTPAPTLKGDDAPQDAFRLTPRGEVLPVRVLDGRDRATALSLPATLEPRAAGGQGLILDLGLNLSGRLALDLDAPPDHQPVQAGFGESLALLEPRGDSLSGFPWERYRPARPKVGLGGAAVTEPHYGFRYAWLTARQGPVRLRAARALPEIAAPGGSRQPYPGTFRCSDDELTRVWYAGAYTAELCTYPEPRFFLDGAKRDRTVWTGDLWVAALATYVSGGDTLAVRNSLSLLAGLQARDGYVPAIANPSFHERNLLVGLTQALLRFAEYVPFWIMALRDYYWHTGDEGFARALFPSLVRAVGWLERQTGRGRALIRVTRRTAGNWHPPELPTGTLAAVNCLTAGALAAAADLARGLGETGHAEAWLGWRERLVQEVNGRLWDEARGAYVLGDRERDIVQDANAAAVLAGVATPERAERALATLAACLRCPAGPLTAEPGVRGMSAYVSPFASFYELLARAQLEDLPGILSILRTCWAHMLHADPASTVWEKMACDGRPVAYPGVPASQTSLAHTWAAGPTYVLSSALLGVRPIEPGYTHAAVQPLLAPAGDALTWAEGTVPTPHGGIRVRWERTGTAGCRLEVQVPQGITARVRFPMTAQNIVSSEGTPARPDRLEQGYPWFDRVPPGRHAWETADG